MSTPETPWETRMRLQKERHQAEDKVRLAIAEYERAAARETDFLEKMWEETRLGLHEERERCCKIALKHDEHGSCGSDIAKEIRGT